MKEYLSLVKFSHTIFAMPFAMIGVFLAHHLNQAQWRWDNFLLVILCMILARNAAMAFNRYLDRDIDAHNDRTRQREIPVGRIAPRSALIFVIVNALLFIICAGLINRLCLFLSPIALLVVLGYSYTKRFTALCHFVLGAGLALAPIGAYVAIAGTFHLVPVLYGLAVLLWVAGFDIIYSLQDESFDKSLGLHSTPTVLGGQRALVLSKILHFFCALTLLFAGYLLSFNHPSIGFIHWIAVGVFSCLLAYQHSLVRYNDLSKVNMAFFTTNGIASVAFSILVILDFYL